MRMQEKNSFFTFVFNWTKIDNFWYLNMRLHMTPLQQNYDSKELTPVQGKKQT